MTNVLMYHLANQHLREVPENEIDRLAESGWRRVEKHDLVAVYKPSLNDHKTVLKADLQTWLNLGYYAEPTMVYHPEKDPRMVSSDQAKEMLAAGWYDSPAKFPGETSVAFTAPAAPVAPVIAPSTPPAKALADMTKAEISQLYFDTFDKTLDADLTKAQMIAAFDEAKASAATA